MNIKLICFHTHSCRLSDIVRGYRRFHDRCSREGHPIFVLQLRHAYHARIWGDHASITYRADARLYGSGVRSVLSHDSCGGAGRHASLEAAIQQRISGVRIAPRPVCRETTRERGARTGAVCAGRSVTGLPVLQVLTFAATSNRRT